MTDPQTGIYSKHEVSRYIVKNICPTRPSKYLLDPSCIYVSMYQPNAQNATILH